MQQLESFTPLQLQVVTAHGKNAEVGSGCERNRLPRSSSPLLHRSSQREQQSASQYVHLSIDGITNDGISVRYDVRSGKKPCSVAAANVLAIFLLQRCRCSRHANDWRWDSRVLLPNPVSTTRRRRSVTDESSTRQARTYIICTPARRGETCCSKLHVQT